MERITFESARLSCGGAACFHRRVPDPGRRSCPGPGLALPTVCERPPSVLGSTDGGKSWILDSVYRHRSGSGRFISPKPRYPYQITSST